MPPADAVARLRDASAGWLGPAPLNALLDALAQKLATPADVAVAQRLLERIALLAAVKR